MAEARVRSVAPLEPPICSACQIGMIWYRSIRADPNSVVRYFYCPECNDIGVSSAFVL
jgi:hypothetical protein